MTNAPLHRPDAIETLVDFVVGTRFEDLPADVVASTQRFIRDNIGDAYAGARAEGCPEIARLVKGWGGAPESRLLGWRTRVPMPQAVWVNSTQSRALELDDVHEPGLMHATSGSVPVALAVAELVGSRSGRDLITATALGIEVSCRLAMAPEVSSAISGMSFTFQCTTFGAAATAGLLMGLDAGKMRHAMGIAYSQVAGNQQTLREGALMTRVQQGLSAKSGALAALLARQGIDGPREVLEGRFGYFRIYHADRYDRRAVVDRLGTRWEIREISTKPYPCCRYIHSTVRAIADLTRERTIDLAAIESVQVQINNREQFNLVCEPLEHKQRPRTVAEAQFSVPYVTAAALRRGGLTLDDFTERALADETVLDLARRVVPCIDPQFENLARAAYPAAHVQLRLRSGEVLTARSPAQAPGHPTRPLTEAEHLAKFRDCMNAAPERLPEAGLERLIARLDRLHDADDLDGLWELLP